MFSMSAFHEQYETDISPLAIGENRFQFFVPKSLDSFLDKDDVFNEFPLWSKIWEASIVLANHLTAMPADPQKHLLEIGCGIGVVGIVAAYCGHRVTMTEYNRDSLNFARANARVNHAPEFPAPEIVELDWTRPALEGRFDMILGSEVVYKEAYFEPLMELFKCYLKPNGEIVLAEGLRKTSMEFFKRMSDTCNVKAQKKILRSAGEEKRVILASMRFKKS
ncbi:MAG: protein N-lysine methyltransferase family protein [Deltaproteobacteria bacterium]|nr:protein N-lysine methyltransferase family protein [Deltaproteobacteria bacterium]